MRHAWAHFRRGEGLGNRLFPWARARVWSRLHGSATLAPAWRRLSVGALLRGGIDLRAYRTQIALMGVFRPLPGDVVGRPRRALLRRATRVPEPADLSAAPPGAAGEEVVVFEGYEGYFAPLAGWHAPLLEDFRAMTRNRWLALADGPPSVPIAANVRCGGDFGRGPVRDGRIAPGDRTPIAWFVDLVRLLRREAGRDAPLYVVSDGARSQVRDLLSLGNATFVRPGCGASDLLTLARARVLLASGSSSFSAWGAFFGGMPVASHPGQPLSAWRIPPREGALLAEVDPSAPAPAFLEAAARALRA